MIRYAEGNLFDASVEALVNTVNEVGVMGKGVALMFREKFPTSSQEYQRAARNGEVQVGRMYVTEGDSLVGPRWLVHFPTKKHWRHPSKLAWIRDGLRDLIRVIHRRGIRSVALPPLGCGNGGLDWHIVRREIEWAFDAVPGVDCIVYRPTVTYQNTRKDSGIRSLTVPRALIAELIRRYEVLGNGCTTLEVQKLAWFIHPWIDVQGLGNPLRLEWVRLFFVEEFSPYSWAFLPADASLQCSFRGDSNQASAYPRLSGGQPSLETVPNTVGLSPSGALPSGHSRGVLVRCRGKGGRPAMAVTTGFQGRTFDVARTGVPCIDLPSPAPCAAADAVFADAKAFLSSSEARQMSESELERELHRRRQDLVRKLLQGHRDQRSPKEAAGPAEDTGGVECSEPREHESHAETTSGTMQVVGLGCARRGHDGLHRLDAALNLLPERYLVEMRRRVTIATASRAPPRTPWKPQWYSTSSTWQRRRGVRCSSSARRRACRHLVRDPMGVDRRTVTFGCSCGGSQPPQAAGALMRTETSHEAREDQRKSPIGR